MYLYFKKILQVLFLGKTCCYQNFSICSNVYVFLFLEVTSTIEFSINMILIEKTCQNLKLKCFDSWYGLFLVYF